MLQQAINFHGDNHCSRLVHLDYKEWNYFLWQIFIAMELEKTPSRRAFFNFT